MMDENELRKAIIADPQTVRSLLLSAQAVELVNWVKIRRLTSSELSDGAGISIQNASVKLNTLYKKGYLRRKRLIHESGGFEYIYESAI